jgi:glycerol-3-phosphate dehydrogenase
MSEIRVPKMDRTRMVQAIVAPDCDLDLLVVGGGATGASVLLDAAARGLRVALLERSDFGKGTSSRSTKLVHGGVRYLAQGNIGLVREALHERTLLHQNAPNVVHELSFLVPCSGWWERWWYGMGFWVYGWLAGKSGYRDTISVSAEECLRRIPTLKASRARGGVLYSDGQFDDCRLLVELLQTGVDQGGLVLNYAAVEGLIKDPDGRVRGVHWRDRETGESHSIRARCVVNATGPFCDQVRRMDRSRAEPLVAASQGVHLVLPASFLQGSTALMVPKTSDGRVLFLIPWLGHVVVGTTDTPIPEATLEPTAQEQEIDFLLETAAAYLKRPPTRQDILSVFVGIRPLVRTASVGKSTAKLSRDHTIEIAPSGLITITGGKWTTARHMAEDCVNRAIAVGGLKESPCATRNLRLLGADGPLPSAMGSEVESVYGIEPAHGTALLEAEPRLAAYLHPDCALRRADVVWAIRYEMARTVEDVLARRSRVLFLNHALAVHVAPAVAACMAEALGHGPDWVTQQLADFASVATHFQPPLEIADRS